MVQTCIDKRQTALLQVPALSCEDHLAFTFDLFPLQDARWSALCGKSSTQRLPLYGEAPGVFQCQTQGTGNMEPIFRWALRETRFLRIARTPPSPIAELPTSSRHQSCRFRVSGRLFRHLLCRKIEEREKKEKEKEKRKTPVRSPPDHRVKSGRPNLHSASVRPGNSAASRQTRISRQLYDFSGYASRVASSPNPILPPTTVMETSWGSVFAVSLFRVGPCLVELRLAPVVGRNPERKPV
ncbi:hypothetical protein V8C37DRAFT_157335 [Trichoderma ceciliae]